MTKPAMRVWAVAYERTCRGTAIVKARTAEEAAAKVNDGGDFDYDSGEEMVDWRATGPAKEER